MTRRRRPRMLLQVPPEPILGREIRIDAATTPTRLTLRVMRGAPRYTLPAAGLAVTHQVGEALVPVLMGIAVERAVSTGDLAQLLIWLAVLGADFLVLSFSWRFGSRLAELGMLVVQHRVRVTLAAHLLRRPPRPARPSEQPGVALSVATSDVNRLSEAVEIAVYPVGQFAAVLFGGAVLLSIAWPLGVAVLVGAPLIIWATERAGRRLRERSVEEQAAAATAAGRAADLMAGYRVIRGIGAEDEAGRRYRSASRAALADTVRARRAEGVFGGTMSVAVGLFLTGVAVAAGLLAAAGSLSIGAFIAVVGLTQFLIDPLESVALRTGAWWASSTASARRIIEVLADAERSEDGTAPRADPARAGDEPCAGIAASATAELAAIAPGELVAVDVDGLRAGDVLCALRALHPDALIAPHAPHLFGGTVRENVRLDGVDEKAASSGLAAAGCAELERVLPHGFDSPVGEGGGALSGGQRQRVALARALAQEPELLVLHDPTTSVDAVTESRIAAAVRSSRARRRTVVVTRSPAFARVADRVVRVASPTAQTEESG